MADDPLLPLIVHELVARHGARTVLLYGSRAKGTARPDSAWLDAWIVPEAELAGELAREEATLMRLVGGRVLLEQDGEGTAFLPRCAKMAQRERQAPAGDPEAGAVGEVALG